MNEARIDKWLWAARIFKTRSIAADACKNGRVTLNGVNLKPSRTIKEGGVVIFSMYGGTEIKYQGEEYLILAQRDILAIVYENVTDPKQYELLQMSRISGFIDRAHGTGRPTKKERRALDAFVDPVMFGFDDEDEGDE